MPLLHSCCQPPWCFHLSRNVLAVTLCYEIYIAFATEPFPSGQLSAVFEEIVGEPDLIKCVETDFKMVWSLFVRRKVQQNLVLLSSDRSAPFTNQNEASGRGCTHGRTITAEETPFMGRFCLLTIATRLSVFLFSLHNI